MNKDNPIENLFLINPKTFSEKVDIYQRMINEIKSCITYFDDNPNYLIHLLNECNAMAFEKSLELILVYCGLSDIGKKNMKTESSKIIEKCFKQPRMQTKNYGIDILLLFSENFTNEIIEILIANITSNKPNIVNGVLETFIQMVKRIKRFPLQDVAKHIPVVLESRDKGSRDLSKKLAIEICTIFGRNKIEPFLKDLPPLKLNELQQEFDKILPPADVDESKSVVDLLLKMPANFYDKIDGSRQERKEILDALLTIIDDSPLPNGNYRELVKKLCFIVAKDPQIQSVSASVRILCQLARGLRKHFGPYILQTFEVCLDKFKEKKPIVLMATRDCIDAVFVSANADVCIDPIVRAIDNKNPSIRMETVAFLVRAIQSPEGRSTIKKNFKMLMPALRKACDDQDPKVREQVFQLVAELMALCGQKTIISFVSDIDPSRMQHITSLVPNCVSVTQAVVQQPQPFEAKPESTKIPIDPPTISMKKPITKTSKEMLISEQELGDRYIKLLGKDVVDKMSSQVWKSRQEACDRVIQFVAHSDIDRISCQILVQFALQKPGLKDSNIMVVRKRLQILQDLFCKCSLGLSLLVSQICLGEIVDKVGDVKLGSMAKETLGALFSKSIDPSQLVIQCLQHLVDSKSIRSTAENLDWLVDYLSKFDAKSATLKDTLPFLRQLLASSNSTVRQNSVTLIGTLYRSLGNMVLHYYESEKPAIYSMISTEISKVDKAIKELKSKNAIETKVEMIERDEFVGNSVKTLDPNIQINTRPQLSTAVIINDDRNKDLSQLSSRADDCIRKSDGFEREMKDSCRSFVLDMCDKLAVFTQQHSCSLFQEELGLYFASVKSMCDQTMKLSINVLLSALQTGWIEKESISTQTQSETQPIVIHSQSPVMKPEKIIPQTPTLGEFVTIRRKKVGDHKTDKENIPPATFFDSEFAEQLTIRNIDDNYSGNGGRDNIIPAIDNRYESGKIAVIVNGIIDVLENENSSIIIYENLSKLKRILRDDSRKQIQYLIPQLLTALSKRAGTLAEIAVQTSIQELIQIVTIISIIYSESEFVSFVLEPVLSSICHNLFLILSNEKLHAIEIFPTLKKIISSLILQMTTSSASPTEVLCALLRLLCESLDNFVEVTVYINVLIRSTLKILETIKSTANVELNLYKVMMILNRPFVDYWHDENKTSTVLFKTIKTIVDVLTKMNKSQLFQYLPYNNDELTAYIYRCLNRLPAQ